LHVGESIFIAEGEEDIGAENGGNDCADTVEGLRNVDSNFGVARGTAN
jgi:hypothetical protein